MSDVRKETEKKRQNDVLTVCF